MESSQSRIDMASLGHNAVKYTTKEAEAATDLYAAFEQSALPLAQRLHAFARHVRRQDVARLLARYEIFKTVVPVNGSVVECGVFTGAGLFSWLHFSAILEPYNHTRRIIGFDTFSGFPGLDDKDTRTSTSKHLYGGAFGTHPSIREELERLMAIHDANRPLGHIPKVELVAGDACETIPRYLEQHPHVLIALLYMDFDLYEPSRIALETLLPRVVRGGIVAFDELNCEEFPGETTALLETMQGASVELKRFPFEPYISYFVKD